MRKHFLILAATFVFGATAALAQGEPGLAPMADAGRISPPKTALGGHEPGEDYFLVNYTQLAAYMNTVAGQSDRTKLVEIGKTVEGRSQYMLVISSPENIKALDKYKDIATRLAHAENLTEDQARQLARDGKAVVWIGSGIHSTETVPTQTMMLQTYKAVTDNDPEWRRILNDTIILLAHNNPDGTELVSNWYMRNPEPTKRIGGASTIASPLANPPQLYHRYVGHDNNRDFLMMAQPESQNITRILFREWFPEIVYDHHQTGPTGAVVFIAPFRDPFNYDLDPLTITELSEVGLAMHSRLVAEGKPGSTMRSGSTYSTWFNGALRTVSYFHNSIGILSEIIGNATPMPLPLVPETQLPHNDLPYPVPPQTWHLRQSVDYELSLNRAILDYASRNRERLLFNIYKMGANSIKSGSEDHWTVSASRVYALEEQAKSAAKVAGGVDPALYEKVLHAPEHRDPRGYIIPADQPDFPTAIKFLNVLIKSGVTVQRATSAFTVAGKTYPAGSFAVLSAQAYRPEILDSFEPQDHPMDLAYPGGPPVRPYDLTGYTIAFQMGIKFDRILDGFTGPFQPVHALIKPDPGAIVGSAKAGYLIDHKINDAAILTNRLLKANVPVYWIKSAVSASGGNFAPGAIWVPASSNAAAILDKGAKQLGIAVYGQDTAPAGERIALKAPRIALIDVYFGSMPSGWTRWLLEQFEFPYTRVYPQRLDAGNLRKDFDVIIMPDGVGVSDRVAQGGGGDGRGTRQPDAKDIPPQYASWLGSISREKTAPQLTAFVKSGGALLAVGNSAGVADMLGIPVNDAVVETAGGEKHALPMTKFYIPGALLQAQVDTANPLGYGEDERVDFSYNNNPSFTIPADAGDIHPAATFTGDKLLRSGWAIGQEVLKGTSPIVDAKLGAGHVFLMGAQVTERAEPHGSFKFFFNGLYYGAASSK